MWVFWILTYGTKESPDSERPQDRPDRQHEESPNQDDKQNSPKVSYQGSSCRWKSEQIPIYVQVVDRQPDGIHSDLPGLETGSQDDDDALLKARITTVVRRRFTDGGNRLSCPRAHPPHYSTTMRYVEIRSFLPRVNNTFEPPSPELHEHALESDGPAPGSPPGKPHSSPGPPITPSVEMPDPNPISDNPVSSEGNRRTIGEWFRTVMTKRSNRVPRQPCSEAHPQPGIPAQTKASPSNEKPSIMSPGRRQAVSMPSSVDTGHRYLTTQLSGRLESPLLDHRLLHASYPFMNIITYYAS